MEPKARARLPKTHNPDMMQLRTCPICHDTYPGQRVVTEVVLDGKRVLICDECVAEQERLVRTLNE